MNQSYNEQQTGDSFNWYQALRKDLPEWDDLRILSSSWITCACGNQCSIIPRNSAGVPEDGELKRLGLRFDLSIADRNVIEALLTLDKIEKRSAQIIEGIKGKESTRGQSHLLNFTSPDTTPLPGVPILIKYQKGKRTSRGKTGIFLTQGYVSSHKADYLHKEDYVCWNDYASRLLVTDTASSKNKILGWLYL